MISGSKDLGLEIFSRWSYINFRASGTRVAKDTAAYLEDISPSGDFSPGPGKRPPRWLAFFIFVLLYWDKRSLNAYS